MAAAKLDAMIKTVEVAKLQKFNKEDLTNYVNHLRDKVDELQSYQLIAKRVEMLERSHILSLQYNRRESLEIYGIPENICDKDLESKALNILTEIGVTKIQHWQVHACHRLKNKKNDYH